jgi:tRNA(Ile)-lysidine synthase
MCYNILMENFETNIIEYMTDNKMLGAGDKIGVAVSGGADSMALLHFMHELSDQIGTGILALHINHGIRKNARKDAGFVRKYCADNGIQCAVYNVNVPEYCRQNKLGVEQGARILRYQCFETAVKKYKLTKIALAHHLDDQAETILLHLFRGCGLEGAGGMKPVSGVYIRPFLNVKKTDLIAYNYRNGTPNITDESNDDNKYARNFIRNTVMPTIQQEWRNVAENIVDFGKIANTDNEYIKSQADTSGVFLTGNTVRIPINRFVWADPVVTRLILKCLEMLDAKKDIEGKHLNAITELGRTGINGEKIDIPNGCYAVREYEYITIVKKEKKPEEKTYSFKIGKTAVEGFGAIMITKTISFKIALDRGLFVIDADKLPRRAKWRFKHDGDQFTKFGGGTKNLGAFFTDKKIPTRLRGVIPVLADGSEIFVVGGLEISDKVKVDRETTEAFVIEFVKA